MASLLRRESPLKTTVDDVYQLSTSFPEDEHATSPKTARTSNQRPQSASKAKSRSVEKELWTGVASKRRCVSTACIACRKRKSKCDGNTPSCAACSSVYGSECIYDPNSDHRRKGVYKKDIDNLKTRNSTLQTLIEAILNFPEEDATELVKQIRTCDSLDDVAESVLAKESDLLADERDVPPGDTSTQGLLANIPQFEKELSGKVGKLRLDNGSISIIGGTSNLIWIGNGSVDGDETSNSLEDESYVLQEEPVTSWTEVTKDPQLVTHLLNMYFTWHYTYFTTLSRTLFWRDFKQGNLASSTKSRRGFCTPLLVNAMLALGCHFTSWPGARADPDDSSTAGDHFFNEAKRLMLANDEHEKPRLTTVQALALMSVREAGCGREARGWVYSGMSFRMAYELGLNIDSGRASMDEAEVDSRRMTMWGCFLFDKCWSNYLGRQPQLPLSNITISKFDVFPAEDAEIWRPYLDTGTGQANAQPARTRAVALQTSSLCEISGDLLQYFYHPQQLEQPLSKQAEIKKLSELHTRLEAWRRQLPKEMEAKDGQLPNILVMHMFFQLLFIHLFRPFLKYRQKNSPLPAHVSPRKILIHSATTISKLLRLYRRTYGLRQICNIAVYIAHTACTIHLLNLPDKNAQRDIQHGLNHLEEIGEGWLCARRTLGTLQVVARRWNVELPEAAQKTFARVEAKFGAMRQPNAGPEDGMKLDDHLVTLAEGLQPFPAVHSQQRPLQAQQHHLPSPHGPPAHAHAQMYDGRYQHQQPVGPHSLALPSPVGPLPAPVSAGLETPVTGGPAYLAHDNAHAHFSEALDDQARELPGTRYILQSRPSPPTQRQPSDEWIARTASITTMAPEAAQTASHSNGPPRGLVPTNAQQLFGGVQGLIQDQDWWLRDSQQFFATWNQHGETNDRQSPQTGAPTSGPENMRYG